MKSKTTLEREAQATVGADARPAAPGLAAAAARRAMGHGSAHVRVTRATCAWVTIAAVGALWSGAAGAQQAQPAPTAPTQQIQPTQPGPQAERAQQASQTQNPAAAPSRPFGAPSVATSAAPSGIASLGQVTLALGLVLALIFVAAWLMRRLRGFGKTATGALDIVAELPLSQKERAVLIRVGTQQLLIGVAPGRVTTLHVLDEPVGVTPPGSGTLAGAGNTSAASMDRPTFKSLLLKSLGK